MASKLFVSRVLLGLCLLGSASAAAAAAAQETSSGGSAGQGHVVTTPAAARARTDVQIRRIKRLLAGQGPVTETTVERLDKLQRELRGER